MLGVVGDFKNPKIDEEMCTKTVICVVYVDGCLFWARSQSEIYNVMKSFK